MTDAELDALEAKENPWDERDAAVAATGFWTMVRRLPRVVAQVLAECWTISRADTGVLLVCTLVAEVFTVMGLLASTGVLENLFAAGPTPERVRAALPALLLVVAAGVLRAGVGQAASWAQARLQPRVARAVDLRLLRLTTGVGAVAFDDSDFNDAIHRVRPAARLVDGLLTGGLGLLGSVIRLVAVGGVLTVLHPVLLPLLLVAVAPVWWASVRSSREAYRFYYVTSGAERRKFRLGWLMMGRDPAPEIRSYTMRSFLRREYARLADYVLRADLVLARRQTANRVIGATLGGVGTGIVYAALGALLLTGTMALAVAGTALLAVRSAMGALSTVGSTTNRCYEMALFYGDYTGFLEDAETRMERVDGDRPPVDASAIELRDVSFTYPSGEKPALDGVSLTIAAGEVIALVGENGSGKSTLAKIIGGLYTPDSGTITYGGVSVDELDLTELRERCSVISQDFTHWPFTARENVTIGRPGSDDPEARLTEAAEAAGADVVFAGLPNGPDTLLDASFKGGTDLSGGQWQRIAVARGLYRDADLLICDEPTAALDAPGEHTVFAAIRDHAAKRTVVLVTHRMANVRMADRIYVLADGRIVEQGSHTDLMAAEGPYHHFYSLQASAFAP